MIKVNIWIWMQVFPCLLITWYPLVFNKCFVRWIYLTFIIYLLSNCWAKRSKDQAYACKSSACARHILLTSLYISIHLFHSIDCPIEICSWHPRELCGLLYMYTKQSNKNKSKIYYFKTFQLLQNAEKNHYKIIKKTCHTNIYCK